MDQAHLGAEGGEEGGLLHRGVAAADHGDVVVLKEEAIAGRAGGHTAARELLLARDAQVARGGTRGQDDSAGTVLLAVDVHLLFLAAKVDALDELGAQVRAELLGLLAHIRHQIRAHDALGEAREVLNLGGVHQLAAKLVTLKHQGLKLGARRVQGGGVAGRPGADDDHVVQHVRGGGLLCRRSLLGAAELIDVDQVKTGVGHLLPPLSHTTVRYLRFHSVLPYF